MYAPLSHGRPLISWRVGPLEVAHGGGHDDDVAGAERALEDQAPRGRPRDGADPHSLRGRSPSMIRRGMRNGGTAGDSHPPGAGDARCGEAQIILMRRRMGGQAPGPPIRSGKVADRGHSASGLSKREGQGRGMKQARIGARSPSLRPASAPERIRSGGTRVA